METLDTTIPGSGLRGAPSPVRPARSSSTGQAEGLAPGDLAQMHDFGTQGYLTIRLPDNTQLPLNGQLVRIVSVTNTIHGRGADRIVTFRPEPWNFADDAWPGSWSAVAEYFRRVDEPER